MNRTILSGQGEWKMQDAELFRESTIQKFIQKFVLFHIRKTIRLSILHRLEQAIITRRRQSFTLTCH